MMMFEVQLRYHQYNSGICDFCSNFKIVFFSECLGIQDISNSFSIPTLTCTYFLELFKKGNARLLQWPILSC